MRSQSYKNFKNRFSYFLLLAFCFRRKPYLKQKYLNNTWGEGGGGSLDGAGMEKQQGGEDRCKQLPGGGGTLASRPLVETDTQHRKQVLEDSGKQRNTQGGRGGYRRETEGLATCDPHRGQHEYGWRPRAVKGRLMDAVNGGRVRQAAQGADSSGGGQREEGVVNVQVYGTPHQDRTWVAGETERCYNNKRLLMGGELEEEGIQKGPENIEIGGAGGDRIKLLMIATEPRYILVTFQGWNTTRHTARTRGKLTQTKTHTMWVNVVKPGDQYLG